MSAYNVLITDVHCPDCGKISSGSIQFKYGNTSQLSYHVGDKISWGGNDIGKPEYKKVKAYGILQSEVCPFCHNCNINEEYDIFIEDNIIKSVKPMEDSESYLEMKNSEFVVI